LEINWIYDPDGETPAPADSTVVALPTNSSSKIHPFFAGQAPPAIKLAGVHRSIHTTHPSATYRLSDHPVSRVPDKTLGNDGSAALLS